MRSKSMAVNSGDVVDLEVYAKYEGATTTATNPNALITALVSAFGLSSVGSNPIDGSAAYNAFNSAFSSGPFVGRVENPKWLTIFFRFALTINFQIM